MGHGFNGKLLVYQRVPWADGADVLMACIRKGFCYVWVIVVYVWVLPKLSKWVLSHVRCSPPVRWGLLDFIPLPPSSFLPPSSAGPQLQALDRSVPRRTPTATSGGPPPQAPDQSVSRRTSTAISGSECSPPDFNHKESPKIYQIECEKECQKICQILCQKQYQHEFLKRCEIECRNRCQIECQKECQNICQKVCQNRCQIECRIECQRYARKNVR